MSKKVEKPDKDPVEGVPVEEESPVEVQVAAEEASRPEPRTVPTRDDLIVAALAHASILITFLVGMGSAGLGAILGVLIPLAIWYGYRDKSVYTAKQALHATVYQVASILAIVAFIAIGIVLVIVGWTVTGALTAVVVGLCLMPFALLVTVLLAVALLVLLIAPLVYGLYAAYETYQGCDFRYRWVSDWVDQQGWK
jgi:uncharacterized Tic20 family protein